MKFHSIRTYSLLIFLSLHSSCASIFNKSTHRITISIDTPLKSILVNGKQVAIINDVATAKLERNKEPLTIHWQGKDSIRTTVIKSKNSFNYLISNFFTCGLGYLL